ncbi:MAG: DegT/DnrJ/EryC1/StrS family aminotransferase, partial [Thermaerobacterales bacterium]
LRNHGRKRPKGLSVITGQTAFLDWRDWYDQRYFGFMMQMGDIPAALGRVQLRLLDGFLQRRRKAAAYYNQVFADAGIPIDLPVPRSRVNSSFLHYVVRSPKRAEIAAFLADRGIETGVHYPAPLHFLQPARELLGDLTGRFPVAEKWAQEILSLPVGPHLSDTQVEHVAEAVQAFFRA